MAPTAAFLMFLISGSLGFDPVDAAGVQFPLPSEIDAASLTVVNDIHAYYMVESTVYGRWAARLVLYVPIIVAGEYHVVPDVESPAASIRLRLISDRAVEIVERPPKASAGKKKKKKA